MPPRVYTRQGIYGFVAVARTDLHRPPVDHDPVRPSALGLGDPAQRYGLGLFVRFAVVAARHLLNGELHAGQLGPAPLQPADRVAHQIVEGLRTAYGQGHLGRCDRSAHAAPMAVAPARPGVLVAQAAVPVPEFPVAPTVRLVAVVPPVPAIPAIRGSAAVAVAVTRAVAAVLAVLPVFPVVPARSAGRRRAVHRDESSGRRPANPGRGIITGRVGR
jgi:hypothetical protein